MERDKIEFYGADAAEQLRRWDSGGTIWSLKMGGLGPGYEQAIQTLAVEIMRDEIGKPLPEGSLRDFGEATIKRVDEELGDLSGAQVGAAKQLAYLWIKVGPAATLEKCEEEDRRIQVSKHWPHVAPETSYETS